MQLNAIASNERQALCELCPQRGSILEQFAPRQINDVEDCFVDVQLILPWRHLLTEGAYAGDDLAGSITVLDDSLEGLPDLMQIRGAAPKPAQSGIGIGDRSGDRLTHLMRDGGRELPHRRDAIRVCELHLRLA